MRLCSDSMLLLEDILYNIMFDSGVFVQMGMYLTSPPSFCGRQIDETQYGHNVLCPFLKINGMNFQKLSEFSLS